MLDQFLGRSEPRPRTAPGPRILLFAALPVLLLGAGGLLFVEYLFAQAGSDFAEYHTVLRLGGLILTGLALLLTVACASILLGRTNRATPLPHHTVRRKVDNSRAAERNGLHSPGNSRFSSPAVEFAVQRIHRLGSVLALEVERLRPDPEGLGLSYERFAAALASLEASISTVDGPEWEIDVPSNSESSALEPGQLSALWEQRLEEIFVEDPNLDRPGPNVS